MVHKGREPSVDIRCYGDKKWHICIVFTGDMERQMFLDQIFEIKKNLEEPPATGKASDDGDESMQMLGRAKRTDKQDDDDSSVAEDSESEEEIVE